jgi:Rrf2 family protein
MAYSTATFQAVSILGLIHFESEDGLCEYLSTKAISEKLNIPAPTAAKILNKLNSAGLTQSKEGAKGGVLLAKPISEITLLDVFNAVERGKPLFKMYRDLDFENEDLARLMEKSMECLRGADDAMKASLGRASLLDLLR